MVGSGEVGAVFNLVVACMDRRSLKSRPLPVPMRSALVTCVA